MDVDKQSGYAAWQVIPVFFVGYFGFALFFGGLAQIVWYMYKEHLNMSFSDDSFLRTHSMTILILGGIIMSLAVIFIIAACVIYPMVRQRKRRKLTRHRTDVLGPEVVPVPEPESVSVEGEIKTWLPSSASDEPEQDDSSQRVVLR